MKNTSSIFSFLFFCSLLFLSFSAFANKTAMTTYYPSPTGNYSKVHLINNSTGPAASTYCLQTSSTTTDATPTAGHTYINAGTIFTDPTSGFLEICKSDGTVASYPGASFNRFCTTGSAGCPSCPINYRVMPNSNSPFPNVTAYSCIFSGSMSGSTTTAKAGCFSIYGTATTPIPATCNNSISGDPNAYDVGCDTIYSVDMNASGPVYKRNCCFNATGIGTLTSPTVAASTCVPPVTKGKCDTTHTTFLPKSPNIN